MKKSAKRGFTLVELLVTIILLGVIGSIVIYNMMNVSTNSKETEYERFIAKVISAAQTYADNYPETFKDLYINKAYLYITVNDLIQQGYIDDDLVNPYTNEVINGSDIVKANLNTTNGALTFQYPVNTSENPENFLVAMADYVVYGEPYNCMQGAGTYQLSLSEENGDLIMLTSENIEKYHFECTYPSEFKTYGNDKPASYRVGKYTDNAGTYEITYRWVTESGTPKESKRTLRVLSKVKPTFTIKEKTGSNEGVPYDYTFGSVNDINAAQKYTPTYRTGTGWTYLTYTPFVEGADPTTTVYSVTKTALDQSIKRATFAPGATSKVVASNSGDFSIEYPVDDGVKQYDISSTVYGHYNKSYSYSANNSIIMYSKLVIPNEFVQTDGSNWVTDRTLTIKSGVHSPVGIAYYEYALTNRTNEDYRIEPDYTFNDRISQGASTRFPLRSNNRITSDSNKNISILTGSSCRDTKVEYNTVYVRAINDDGYVGDWVSKPVQLTSDISKLLIQDAKCIKDTTTSCHYETKGAYLDYNGHRFVVLEKNSDGSLIVTLNGVGRKVSPIQIKKGEIVVDTCDLLSSANIEYRSPVIENIFAAADLGIPNINRHAIYNKWPVTSEYIEAYHEDSNHGWQTFYRVKTRSSSFSSYYGNASLDTISRYKDAVKEAERYWTINTTSETSTTTAYDSGGGHAKEVSYYNVNVYSAQNGVYTGSYIGNDYATKPMLILTDINVCGTTATSDGLIYKVALS